MPFVPPPGTEVITFSFFATVDQLVYRDETIYAFTESDKELYEHELKGHPEAPRSINAIVADYEDCGWKRSPSMFGF